MAPKDSTAEPDSEAALPPAELRLSKALLLRICWIVIAAMAVIGTMMTLSGAFHLSRFFGQLLIAGIAVFSLLLARRDRLQASASVFAWGMIAAITFFGAVTGGAVTPSTLGYLVVIAAAGWYLGRNTTVALGVASVLALGLLAHAQSAGWLPEPSPSNALFRWLTQAVIFTTGVLLVVAASRAMAIRMGDLERARHEASAALADSAAREAQLRLIADNVPAMIFHGGPDGRCRWANAAYARFMGLTQEAIVGMHVRDIIGEEAYRQVEHQIERVLAGERVLYESTRPGPEGDPRHVEFELVPDVGEGGAVRGLFGLLRDVTERRRQQQLLPSLAKGTARATGSAFFNSLVTQIGQTFGVAYAMVAETADGATRARSLALWSSGGLLPNVEYGLAGTPSSQAIRDGRAYYEHGVQALFPEDKALAAHGIQGYCGLALYDGHGEPIGLLVIAHSAALGLTDEQRNAMEIFASRAGAELERMRLEDGLRQSNLMLERRVEERTAQLTEANRDLEAFSYSVSHDLRAPLRHIGGYARLLAEDSAGTQGAEGRAYLDRILRSVMRLDELISDLLELSKVGRLEMQRKAVNLSYVANEIAEEFEHAEPGRRVDWHIAEGLIADCDERLLRVLLQNLIGNAWKYSGKKKAPRIEFGREDGAFFVRDNGAGFDMQYAGKLFQPFQRMHGASEFEGTGIGLATVARIVSRHGGSIHAEAAPELGATFRFTLPGVEAPSPGG